MKKVVLAIILFSVSVISYSQVIEKGKSILGGSLGFGFSHHKNESTTVSDPQKASGFSINLNPSLGKAVKNNSVFGYYLSLGYSHGKNEDPNQNDVAKSNGYTSGGGIFLEKFFPLNKSISFSAYMPLGFNYNWNKSKEWTNSSLDRTSTTRNFFTGISLSPSLNYSLNKNFLLQLSLNDFVSIGYTHGTTETKLPGTTTQKQSSSNFNVGGQINYGKQLSSLSFGFRYIF